MEIVIEWLKANLSSIIIAAIPIIVSLLSLRKNKSESKKIDSEAEKIDVEADGLVIKNASDIIALWQGAYNELKGKFDAVLKSNADQEIKIQGLHDQVNGLKAKQRAILQFVSDVLEAIKEPRSDVFAITDEKKVILYISPNIFELLGYSPLDFLNRERMDLIHPEDADNFSKIFSHTLQFPEITSRILARYKHRDGSWRWIESTIMNLLQTHVRGIFFASRDITKLKEAEGELRKLSAE